MAHHTDCLLRFLRHSLSQTLSGDLVLSLVRTGKRLLFPNGYPQPSPPDPTPEEQARTRERLTHWQPSNGSAARILPYFLGPDPPATIGAALDPFSDAACNMHLVVMILERVLCELFPELVGGSVPAQQDAPEGKGGS